jgi:hypothetical protein
MALCIGAALRFIIAAYLTFSVVGTFTISAAARLDAVESRGDLRACGGFFSTPERTIACLLMESKDGGGGNAYAPARFAGIPRFIALLGAPGVYAARFHAGMSAWENRCRANPPHKILLKLRI